MSSLVDQFTLDTQTALRLGQYIRAYSDLLAQQVSLSQAIVDLLTRQIGPAAEIAERTLITEKLQAAPQQQTVTPIVVSSVLGPIRQARPAVVSHYNQTTDASAGKTTQMQFKNPPLWIIIDNIDQTNSISVSFDQQRTFKTILKNTALNLPPWTIPEKSNNFDYNFWFKSTVASVSFEVLSGE